MPTRPRTLLTLSFSVEQGHGGGWAGIPGLIVQCPMFICDKGYGVPINVTHPRFREILTDVLREIVDIFDNPPYLHLGGTLDDRTALCFHQNLVFLTVFWLHRRRS
jgi:hypothetical protein